MNAHTQRVENEAELIARSKAGDSVAFGILYDAYIKVIYNFVFYKTFHKETAEDITSQTFFKALKSIQSVDPQKSFLSWLFKIAHNTVIDHYRSWGRHEAKQDDIEDHLELSEDQDIVGELDTARDAAQAREYLKTLSQEEQDIVIMRVWQEMSYKEIAEIVGKTEASCKMSYSRSMKKLRHLLPAVLLLLLTSYL